MSTTSVQTITFNSITVPNTSTNDAVDRYQPLSFIEWLPYHKPIYTTPENALAVYRAYLNEWYATTADTQTAQTLTIQSLYINLLNEITINYSTVDEQRFLSKLDYSNPRDLAIAIPFFAKKIKDVCLYYINLRETAQTATTQYNLKGSNFGIETLVYNAISNALAAQDITQSVTSLNLSISAIRNNMVVNLEEIYDLYPNYFDITPTLPASAYNVSENDTRNFYFESNLVDVDPTLSLDLNQGIKNAILSYPFFLQELGTQLSIVPTVSASQLNYLKDSDFIPGVNTGKAADLNLTNLTLEEQKYIGADFYYVITDSTLTSYTSGILFTADSEFANVLNKRYPTIATVPSTAFLKTGKEMGLFFKPDKIGLLHFTSFNFTPSVKLSDLEPNTVYYFPDPSKYGNVTSNTRQNFVTPLEFFENNAFNKVDFSNQYRFGDVDTDPYYQLFRSYQSREQSLNISNFGISRYTDYQDFFTGALDTIWNNIDVYPLAPNGQLPIDERTHDLYTIDASLFQFKSDIYGNQYGLYKKGINKTKAPRSTQYIPSIGATDLIFNGGSFSDTYIDNTTLNCGKLGIQDVYASINSYRLGAELFDQNYIDSIFTVTTYDCEQFVQPNPNVVYNIDQVLDGSYFSDNTSIIGATIDCYYIAVDYIDQQGVEHFDYDPTTKTQYTYSYTENSTFVDERVPGLSSTLDFSLTGQPAEISVYDARNSIRGSIYCRAPDGSSVAPLSSSTLSAIYAKYTSISAYNTTIGRELNNCVINLDVFYDVLQIETNNHLIFDKIRYDYTSNTALNSLTFSYLSYGQQPQFEKFSNTWFDEDKKQLIVCQTRLLPTLSSSPYKTIYPKIYTVDLNYPQPLQLFPYTSDKNLTPKLLQQYSLSGTGIQLNIVEIEKPILSYNDTTNTYDLTYLAKDTAGAFYTTNIKFKYVNGVLTIISNTLYKPSTDTLHLTFPLTGSALHVYNIFNNQCGYVNGDDNTFTFGTIGYVDEYLLTEDGYFITQENGDLLVL
jgi:hypothetical protein